MRSHNKTGYDITNHATCGKMILFLTDTDTHNGTEAWGNRLNTFPFSNWNSDKYCYLAYYLNLFLFHVFIVVVIH